MRLQGSKDLSTTLPLKDVLTDQRLYLGQTITPRLLGFGLVHENLRQTVCFQREAASNLVLWQHCLVRPYPKLISRNGAGRLSAEDTPHATVFLRGLKLAHQQCIEVA